MLKENYHKITNYERIIAYGGYLQPEDLLPQCNLSNLNKRLLETLYTSLYENNEFTQLMLDVKNKKLQKFIEHYEENIGGINAKDSLSKKTYNRILTVDNSNVTKEISTECLLLFNAYQTLKQKINEAKKIAEKRDKLKTLDTEEYDHLKELYYDLQEKIKTDEITAPTFKSILDDYKTTGYIDINTYAALLTGRKSDFRGSFDSNYIKLFNKILMLRANLKEERKSSIDMKKVTLYRCIDHEGFKKLLGNFAKEVKYNSNDLTNVLELLNDKKPTLIYLPFMSTTLDEERNRPSHSKDGVYLIIKDPNGKAQALNYAEFRKTEDPEKEILLNAHTKLKVEKAKIDSNGVLIVNCEVI